VASSAEPGERVAWFRGEIRPEREVLISFRDGAAVHADGVYDTERTFRGRIFRLDQHLDRLWRSMAYVGIQPPITRAELAEITLEVARRNYEICGRDIWVTQRVSTGTPREYGGDATPTLIVESLPLPFESRAPFFRDGIVVVTPALRRVPPWALSPQAKTVNYLNPLLAGRQAAATTPGAWPILLDEHGNLSEGGGANVFAVRDGALMTPRAEYVLPGITREVVLELAAGLGIPADERDIGLFEATTADEMFVTATSLCVCPIVTFNGTRMRSGAIPGPVTRRLQEAFSDLVGVDIVAQYLERLSGDARPPFV